MIKKFKNIDDLIIDYLNHDERNHEILDKTTDKRGVVTTIKSKLTSQELIAYAIEFQKSNLVVEIHNKLPKKFQVVVEYTEKYFNDKVKIKGVFDMKNQEIEGIL